ncbi:arrestin domain-containing protein 17-like [Zootermopsis nevadensis]|uniref:Arrestin domain-containing protein 3 n=1 Tax=Zootermopsis nevadensis TaxID=136037 RepID=A0A067RHZ3_ZOONE|nr:arrestin domain-containing protein 17-like [Zootermopsis nevadensis]KDR23481.1 Arrestin domain-containing protein 3 [Zootermopsis nevadensis]
MGLKKFQIVFDNPWSTYYSGQPVTGRLLLTVDSPKKIRGIVIHFKGEAAVKWSETETKTKQSTPAATITSTGNEGNVAAAATATAAAAAAVGSSIQNVTVNFSSHEQYFENKFNLLGGSGETELPAGDLCYPFATHLPPNLPSSFEGEHGHVRYTVKAILDRPWKFDQEAKAAFTVISPLDLNTHQTAKEPVKKEVSKHFGFCCWSSGPLTMTLSLPVSGYVPGQDIPITVDVENNSDVPIREVKCTLRKLLTFTVTSPHKSTKKDDINIGELVLGTVEPHGTSNWTQVLKVPPLPPSNLNNCSIIDLDYDLKVKAKASKWHRDLQLATPIILGTVPLTSYQPPVFSSGEKPPGEVNGETSSVPAGTGDATIGYNMQPSVGPVGIGEPQASGNSGWNMLPSDTNAQSQGVPYVQPNVAPQGPASASLYPDLSPATFSESMFGPKNIKDAGDNQYTQGNLEYAPRYPVFNFEDK